MREALLQNIAENKTLWLLVLVFAALTVFMIIKANKAVKRANAQKEEFKKRLDRMKMLKCMRRFREETGTVICAYCLMDNHIHLLLHNEEGPDVFIKKIASSYVYHFNHKYDRVGHLFQDRYKSEPVEDDRYLIAVFRYILQNPWKAGICRRPGPKRP